jgi:hypothetical protein
MRSYIFGLIGVVGVIGLVAAGLSQSSAQGPVSPGKCNPLRDKTDPPSPNSFDTTALDKLSPEDQKRLFSSGLPCQENLGFGNDDFAKTNIQKLQRGFDFHSWLTFIALNAPLGALDGFATAQPGDPTWWESGDNFKPLLDVMLPDGTKPDWKTAVVPPACRAALKANPKLMLVKMIEESFNQPFKTGPLIDQRNNYAIFDILMNRSMFDYIVEHKLYSRAEQASNSNLRVDFPVGQQKNGDSGIDDHGAIMLKVSWKILDPEDDKSKFHHVQALVAMPTSPDEQGDPPCIEKTIGLVGFHVVHKTIGRPQWIWTSFEHVDNVPEQKEIDEFRKKKSLDPNTSPHHYNFYSLSCTTECPVNATPPRPWDPEYEKQLKFRTNADGQAIFNSQIVRDPPLTDATKAMNAQFHALLGKSVWKHYILIGTQWPSDQTCARDHSVGQPAPRTDFEKQPDMNCAPAPSFLANSTLETYSQGAIPQASSSCMGCHGNAVSHQRAPRQADSNTEPPKTFNQSDFTFMLEKAR